MGAINVFGYQMILICLYFRIKLLNQYLLNNFKSENITLCNLEILCKTILKLKEYLLKINDYILK